MNDIISINRQFLIMAREAAKLRSGEILTGLPRSILDKLVGMDLAQIEGLVQGIGVSIISVRLNDAELNRLLSLQGTQKAAYSMAVVASGEQ
jgi:flagellar transcriptional activator FlhD